MGTLIAVILILFVAVALFRAHERARERRAWWEFVRRQRATRRRQRY